MSIRLCLIIPTLDRNGAEKQLTLLARQLPRADFDVHVCTLTRGGPLEQPLREAGIPVTCIGKRWKFDPAAYWKLERYLRELRPDIVHTWLFAANSYGRVAARRAGVKTIIAGERCVDPWKRWHELEIDRRLARGTDRIVTNSSGVRDFYAGKGLPAEKFTVIPNGIEPRSGPREAFSRAELLRQLELPDDAKLAGAVGRLWPQKRYNDLIWATELLHWACPRAYFVIVGEGPQRWRLERYSRQILVSDRVRFLGERDDVDQLLPHFDCFWLASGYEGQSNALMEAMQAGLPVVVSDIPGNRDLVVDGESGFLVRVGDAGEFARRARILFDDPSLARQLGDAARRRMEAEFTVEKMVARHASLYRELAGK